MNWFTRLFNFAWDDSHDNAASHTKGPIHKVKVTEPARKGRGTMKSMEELRKWAETDGIKVSNLYTKDGQGYHRNIDTLHPEFRDKVRAFLEHANRELSNEFPEDKIELCVINAFRTPEMQDKMYATGRTIKKGSKKLTNAKAWESMHCYGLAFDCYPKKNGKFLWNMNEHKDVYDAYIKIGRLYFRGVGADWNDAGHWGEITYKKFLKDKVITIYAGEL